MKQGICLADLVKEIDDEYETVVAPIINKMAEDNWSPAVNEPGTIPLVWLHADGSWGLSGYGIHRREMSSTDINYHDPDAYWWEASRIDEPRKLLKWIAHLSGKKWIRKNHIRQMIILFESLYPGSVGYGL